MVAKLLPFLTASPHRRYVEVFGGGASLLMAKPPVDVEVYNDLDEGLADFFTVLSDPVQFGKFYRRIVLLPWSRSLYNRARRQWRAEQDPIRRVVLWFVVARQSFSGIFEGSWASAVTRSTRGMAKTTSSWESSLERLPAIHGRLARVQIECADWATIIDRYDTPDTLFYCDPPYVHATRRGGRYTREMSDEDHARLVDRLLSIEGAAVLSGYDHPLYRPLVKAGWKRRRFQTSCSAAGRTRRTGILGAGAALAKQPRSEMVWLHPRVAASLARTSS